MFSGAPHHPLTPTLSPEYRGEGACLCSLSRLRERVGVRVNSWLKMVANQVTT